MAEEQELIADDEKTGTKTKWWLIGVGGTVLVILLIIVAVFWFGSESIESPAVSELTSTSDRSAEEARYVSLPRNLTFNVPGADRDRVAQIGVQLLVRGSRHETLAQENIPLLESTLLNTFARTSAERLITSEGKREIRLQALDAVREAMYEATGDFIVNEVLFTNFVIQ